MKKRILVLLMFGMMSINAMALDLWVKGGMMNGISGKVKEPGYTAGLELSQGILGFVDLGVGTAYNGNLKFDDTKYGKEVGYDMVPVYAFAKFNIFPVAVKPYIVGRVGANFIVNDNTNYNDDKSKANSGAYGAIGVGMEFLSSLQAEVLYSVSQVKNNPSGSNNVELVSLTLGYNFF